MKRRGKYSRCWLWLWSDWYFDCEAYPIRMVHMIDVNSGQLDLQRKMLHRIDVSNVNIYESDRFDKVDAKPNLLLF